MNAVRGLTSSSQFLFGYEEDSNPRVLETRDNRGSTDIPDQFQMGSWWNVYTLVLGTSSERSVGSNPIEPTNF